MTAGQAMRRLLLATIPLLVLAGCAQASGDEAPGRSGQSAAPAGEPRYETTATVLQSPEHGPELCLGAVALSLPPQCGGVPIPNWRWDQVPGEQSRAGTTWGEYHLFGSYDGASFTADRVEPARPVAAPAGDQGGLEPACPEPSGGWPQPDPERAGEERLPALRALAARQRDFAGLWVSYLEPMGNDVAEDPGEFVVNVTFTGDLERHRAELRARWGGRLCVARQRHTLRELRGIQRDLDGPGAKALGLQVLSTGVDEARNRVGLRVVVLDQRARDALQRRYGPGVVEATAQLTQVR